MTCGMYMYEWYVMCDAYCTVVVHTEYVWYEWYNTCSIRVCTPVLYVYMRIWCI